jgi:broad specificity phosphatase PhoE
MNIYLVRHAELEGAASIFRGQLDLTLNSKGLAQAEKLGQTLSQIKIESIYTSPLKRASETALAIQRFNQSEPKLIVEPAFNNINLGHWQGERKDEIKRKFPDEWQLWLYDTRALKIPDGETITQIEQRAIGRFKQLVADNRDFAIVSHRTILKVLLAYILGIEDNYFWKFEFDYASYSLVEYTSEFGFTLKKFNII